MKTLLFLLFTLSTLCDLEAQNQPQPLLPESQKNDIFIPTAGREPIKVTFGDNVQSIIVDGHRIENSDKLADFRRRLKLTNGQSKLNSATRKLDGNDGDQILATEAPEEDFTNNFDNSQIQTSNSDFQATEDKFDQTADLQDASNSSQGDSDQDLDESELNTQSSDLSNDSPSDYSEVNNITDEGIIVQPSGPAPSEELIIRCNPSDEEILAYWDGIYGGDVNLVEAEIEEVSTMIETLNELGDQGIYEVDLETLYALIQTLRKLQNLQTYFNCNQAQGESESNVTPIWQSEESQPISEEENIANETQESSENLSEEIQEPNYSVNEPPLSVSEYSNGEGSPDQNYSIEDGQTNKNEEFIPPDSDYQNGNNGKNIRKARLAKMRELNALRGANRRLHARLMQILRSARKAKGQSQFGSPRPNFYQRRNLRTIPQKGFHYRPQVKFNQHFVGKRVMTPVRRMVRKGYRPVAGQGRAFGNNFHRYV